ncbi:hypothetical protein [Azotobacter chroococcum]|uniref:hypothetical protein n=1 Tax=Azotobacter chroococcum TaxID=353 RepID=UPI00201DC6F3|nr:hypothetical protein [Azotobacter chroococcum]
MTDFQRCQSAATGSACSEKASPYRYVAIHEAGHALAYWWNGQFIDSATARTKAERRAGPLMSRNGREVDCDGMVEGSNFIAAPSVDLEYGLHLGNPLLPEMVERDLLHCYAGPVAEAQYRRAGLWLALWLGGGGDMEHARELLALLPEDQRAAAERRTIARCRELVRRYWPAVCALADLLQERGRVEGEDVVDLLCAITGASPKFRSNALADLNKRGACHG